MRARRIAKLQNVLDEDCADAQSYLLGIRKKWDYFLIDDLLLVIGMRLKDLLFNMEAPDTRNWNLIKTFYIDTCKAYYKKSIFKKRILLEKVNFMKMRQYLKFALPRLYFKRTFNNLKSVVSVEIEPDSIFSGGILY